MGDSLFLISLCLSVLLWGFWPHLWNRSPSLADPRDLGDLKYIDSVTDVPGQGGAFEATASEPGE